MDGTDYWNDRFSARDFEQLSASGGPGVSILAYDLADRRRIGDGADRGSVAYVTANYFSILGVPLLSGRTFGSNEDNYRDPRRVTVLSLQFANHFFGGSRQALGQTLRVDNVSYTVVGVADGNFSGVDLDRVDMWVPLSCRPSGLEGPWFDQPGSTVVRLLARVAAAQGPQISALTGTYRRTHTADSWFDDRAVLSFSQLQVSLSSTRTSDVSDRNVALLQRLLVAAVLVGILAALNTLSLVLHRAYQAQHDDAVLAALGASASQLIARPLSETLLIGQIGAVLTACFSLAGAVVLRDAIFWRTLWPVGRLDSRTVVLAYVLSSAIALLGGLLQCRIAVRQRTYLPSSLGSGRQTSRRTRMPRILLAVQTAICVALIIIATSLVESLIKLSEVSPGFDVANVITVRAGGLGLSLERLEGAMTRVAQLPQVVATVAAASDLRPGGTMAIVNGGSAIDVSARKGVAVQAVAGGYLRAAGMLVTRGRELTAEDVRSAAPVAVVNVALVHTLNIPGDPTLGCIVVGSGPCLRIVGVVSDLRWDRTSAAIPTAFVPLPHNDPAASPTYFVVRTRVPATGAAVREIEGVLRAAFPEQHDLPIVQTVDDRLAPQLRPWRIASLLFLLFGIVAAFSAAAGTFGVVSYATIQRRREIAIRVALGFGPLSIVRLIVGEALAAVGLGFLAGLVLTYLGRGFFNSFLFDTPTVNTVSLAVAAAVSLGVAIVSALVPARNAAFSEPGSLLRED